MEGPLDRKFYPKVKLAQYATPNESEIGRCRVGIATPCGEASNPAISVFCPRVAGVVDVWMDSDPGMRLYRPGG